jgi:hypothetical protein
MNANFFRTLLGASFLLSSIAWGLPIQSGPHNIDAEIQDWIYRDEINYSRSSQGLSVEYKIPGHYILILKDNHLDQKIIKNLNQLARSMNYLDPILYEDLEKNQIIVLLFVAKEQLAVAIGKRCVIAKYNIIINCSGKCRTSYEKLIINHENTPDKREK